MTWTTIGPDGATATIGVALITLSALALVYALGLLYRVLQMRRPGRVPAEGLEEDLEAEEP